MASKRIGTVSAPRVDWDLLKDQAELLGQIQDYLKRDWSAAKKWISAVEGILNLLAALRPTSERHNRREAAGLRAIEQFRKHLASDKFRGTEYHCSTCQRATDEYEEYPSSCCRGAKIAERKDWISTSDVLNWLRGIEEHLKYEDHEIREGWR